MQHTFTSLKKSTESFLFYEITCQNGLSGSPIIRRDKSREYVIGVHVAGTAIEKSLKNGGVRLNREKRRMINEWVGEVHRELNLSTLWKM